MGVAAQSQTKKKSLYPVFTIRLVGGSAFLIGKFGENFKTARNFGFRS